MDSQESWGGESTSWKVAVVATRCYKIPDDVHHGLHRPKAMKPNMQDVSAIGGVFHIGT